MSADPVADLKDRWLAELAGCKIILADGDDQRVRTAAQTLARMGAQPILIGGGSSPNGSVSIDPSRYAESARLADALWHIHQARGLTFEDAVKMIRDPLILGGMMVREGLADGLVGGATRPTADVIRAAIRTVGLAPGSSIVSSCFVMVLAGGPVITYGDCGVVPNPDAEQLAAIAVSCARSHRALVGTEPVVAMLSFSTKGSAEHDSVIKVRQATELARCLDPGLEIDGELQFDAAWLAEIGERKAPGSSVPGRANVFIFPNLDAGNIAYKITERLAGSRAYGPILQGLAAPVNDLSRGASAADIEAVAAITAVLARTATSKMPRLPGERSSVQSHTTTTHL